MGWYLNGDSRWRWHLKEYYADFVTTFLGIFVTLALARAVKLILHLYDLAAHHNQQTGRNWHGLSAAGYETSITIEHTIAEQLSDAWHQAGSVRPAVQLLPPGAIVGQGQLPAGAAERKTDWAQVWRAIQSLLIALTLIVIYVGVLAGGVMTIRLKIDDLALGHDPDCAYYVPSNLSSVVPSTMSYDFDVEADSAKYASDCYNGDLQGAKCDTFAQKDLPWQEFHDAPCPFEDSLCHFGQNTSYRLATPPIPATAIGVNARSQIEFMREAIFTPLNMNDSYIHIERRTKTYEVFYNYGLNISFGAPAPSNVTWVSETHGDMVGKAAAYTIGAKVWERRTNWQLSPPIEPLRTEEGDILTILIIQAGKIYYTKPSKDPIFPTTKGGAALPGYEGSFWLYTSGWARPLAALDRVKWRDLAQSRDWHDVAVPPQANHHDRGDLWLMWTALQNSSTYGSISRRLGNGLLAASRINGWTSLPLSDEQWKVEALHMFKTSLARIQLEAYNIARGVQGRYPGLTRLPGEPALCDNTFFYHDTGHSNVNGGLWLGIFLPLLFLVLIPALPSPDEPGSAHASWPKHGYLLGSWLINRIWPGAAEILAYWTVRLSAQLCDILLAILQLIFKAIWNSMICLYKQIMETLRFVGECAWQVALRPSWAAIASGVRVIRRKIFEVLDAERV